MEHEIYKHTCTTCGDEKEIVLHDGERPEDLEGCVCDRTVEKVKFVDSNDLLKNMNRKF